MKILLLGKHGQLGFELQRSLAPLGQVLALGQSQCDFRDTIAIERCVDQTAPDVIVNAVAYTAVDKAESETALAFAVNAKAPETLARVANKHQALLLHYSTDYVFDGDKNTPYSEEDDPNPQNVYGQSKYAGEQAIAANTSHFLILRTSWVLGAHGGNFLKTMLKLGAQRSHLDVVFDQTGAPTSAALLSDVSAHILKSICPQTTQDSTAVATASTNPSPSAALYGLYHCTASGATNWHAYACYVLERARSAKDHGLRLDPHAITPISSAAYAKKAPVAAHRPKNSRLDSSKLCQTFGLSLPIWQDGVNHVLQQLENNRGLNQ